MHRRIAQYNLTALSLLTLMALPALGCQGVLDADGPPPVVLLEPEEEDEQDMLDDPAPEDDGGEDDQQEPPEGEGPAVCGDGVLQDGETCDGGCPTSCDDGDACTTDTLQGSKLTCDAVCVSEPVTACQSGDGCCPSGCDATSDSDCSAVCGNLVVEDGETCDGDCPTQCDDGDVCTSDTPTGSQLTCDLVCESRPISQCISGDGCCPASCTPELDDDCVIDCTDLDAWPQQWADFEAQVLVLVNEKRAEGATCGGSSKPPVGPLTMDPQAQISARCHSLDMATQDYFDHTGLDGSHFSTRMSDAGFTGYPVGENIAAGQGSPESVMRSWMNSPGHCSNIMKSQPNVIGIGFALDRGAQYGTRWTQVFGAK